MLIILIGVMVSRVYTDVKIYQTAHIKYVQLIMFQLCLNKEIYMALYTGASVGNINKFQFFSGSKDP